MDKKSHSKADEWFRFQEAQEAVNHADKIKTCVLNLADKY